jgi:hypothetical protein
VPCRSRFERISAAVALSVLMLQGPGPAEAAPRSVAAGPGGPLTAADEVSASVLAASVGHPVEVLGDRTDWAQTFAEPGGGFLTQESAVPVRVQRADGSWVAVDTTLSARADGLVVPGAVVPGLVMSGGGRVPLYTLTSASGGSVSVSWPYGSLPSPSLAGPTATYSGVLPGVNLLVTATPTGVQSVLQVMSAAAAANPELGHITFPVSAPGLSVSADRQGGLAAADSSGNAVFTAPPARMWDSAAGAVARPGLAAASGSAPGLAGPQAGDHMAVAAVSAGRGAVSLSPRALLGGVPTVYPVYIDPNDFHQATQASWLDVARDFASPPDYWGNPDYTDPAGGIRSGVFCSPDSDGRCLHPSPDSTWAIYRSYLNFAIPSGLAGASFVDAQLDLNEVWSWSCTASTMELWQTTEAKSGGTWTSRPAEQTWQDSITTAHGWTGTSGACPVRGITLNASSALGKAAAQGWGQVTLEVRASLSDEDASPPVVNSWKRFQATASGDCSGGAPCLQVFWAHDPDQAQAAGTEGTFDARTGQTVTDCATSQGSPDYVSTTRPQWDASAGDQEGSKIYGRFPWTNITTGATGTWPANVNPVDAGSQFQGQRTGSGGDEYKWQAYGEARPVDPLTRNTVTVDGKNSSPPCYFTIDTTAPAGTAAVSSDTYQDNVPSGQIGMAGTFTLTDPDPADSDVAGYFYGVGSSQPSAYVPAANGTASITLAPYTSSQEDLYVQAVDRAGNRGPLKMSGSTTVPSFVIIPGTALPNITTLGYWPLNSATGSDGSGKGNDLAKAPGASYPCAQPANPPGYLCSLSGEADTSRPVVSNQAGFTVSAWVSLPYCQSYCAAMSEDASDVPTFSLAWRPSGQSGCPVDLGGCWEFSMRYSDDNSAALDKAQAAITQVPPNWVQLTGVFDPLQVVGTQRGTLTLYVNGMQAAQFAGVPIWSTTPSGVLRLGAGPGGAYPWVGSVSDACAFYGALQPSDAQLLYTGNSSYSDGCNAVYHTYH